MDFKTIAPGKVIPHDINVIIEIAAHSEPVKYEVDKKTGAMWVDRFMSTAMYYPTNYGYVPQTLAEDNDPLDVLVVAPTSLLSGSVINCRPIGVLKMTDESGVDAKILAVPHPKLTSLYKTVQKPEHLPGDLLKTIAHFFTHYKDLEEGKWVKVDGWYDNEVAKAEIKSSIARYKNQTASFKTKVLL